jgi:hypothetical protein
MPSGVIRGLPDRRPGTVRRMFRLPVGIPADSSRRTSGLATRKNCLATPSRGSGPVARETRVAHQFSPLPGVVGLQTSATPKRCARLPERLRGRLRMARSNRAGAAGARRPMPDVNSSKAFAQLVRPTSGVGTPAHSPRCCARGAMRAVEAAGRARPPRRRVGHAMRAQACRRRCQGGARRSPR